MPAPAPHKYHDATTDMELLSQQAAAHREQAEKLKERSKESSKKSKAFKGFLVAAAAAIPMLLVAGGVFAISAAAAPFFWPILAAVLVLGLAYTAVKAYQSSKETSKRHAHEKMADQLEKTIDERALGQVVKKFLDGSPKAQAATQATAGKKNKKLYEEAREIYEDSVPNIEADQRVRDATVRADSTVGLHEVEGRARISLAPHRIGAQIGRRMQVDDVEHNIQLQTRANQAGVHFSMLPQPYNSAYELYGRIANLEAALSHAQQGQHYPPAQHYHAQHYPAQHYPAHAQQPASGAAL